jgi:tetratricopeptide (TPR) repeat protein
VGRDAELAALRDLAAGVFSHGGLGAATVLGEAGLGKSRLLAEVLAEVQADLRAGLRADLLPSARPAALWSASSHPQGLNQPSGLLRDLLFWHHGVKDSDTQAQAQQKFAAALAPIFGEAADEQTALLGQLIGLDYSASPFIAGILRDGKQLRARGLHAWAEYLRLQAAQQPLVLVLDDLQWADDESLSAIDHLVAVGAALPVVLLCGARPELLQRRPDWGAAWPAHQTLTLAPLAADANDALAQALLQRMAEPSPQLQALLSSQAAGNPYYMEALLQMLVDRGVIQTEGEHWQVQVDRLQNLQVPPTLVGVLQATLDALAAGERQSLQQASVVGAQFWDEALAAINPQALAHLPALARRELALAQLQSAFDQTQEYAFRHHLLHQVTYGTVLKPDKREGHRHAALWLQSRSAGREAEMASQMAEHFERAGITERALHYWLQAAEDAALRQADSAALAHAERALALALDDGSDLRSQVRIHLVRAAVLMRAGRAADHAEVTAVLESLADRLDDDGLRLSVARDQVWRLILDTKFEEAVDLGRHRLSRGEAHSPAEAARVHNVVFVALCRLGRLDEALVHGQKGLAQARAVGDLLTEGHIHNNIALLIYLDANRVPQGLVCLQQALDAYKAAGSRFSVAVVQTNLALVEDTLCRPERAREGLLRTLQVCQEVGARQTESMVRANLALHLCEHGDAHGALDHALQGLHLAQGAADRFAQAQSHAGAYAATRALGLAADALTHARAAGTAFAEHGRWELAWHYASAAASLLYDAGESTAALARVEAVLVEVSEQGGWTEECFNGPIHLYRVLAPRGDPRAPGLLATAHQQLNALADRYAEFVPREQFLRATALRRQVCDAWAAAQAS